MKNSKAYAYTKAPANQLSGIPILFFKGIFLLFFFSLITSCAKDDNTGQFFNSNDNSTVRTASSMDNMIDQYASASSDHYYYYQGSYDAFDYLPSSIASGFEGDLDSIVDYYISNNLGFEDLLDDQLTDGDISQDLYDELSDLDADIWTAFDVDPLTVDSVFQANLNTSSSRGMNSSDEYKYRALIKLVKAQYNLAVDHVDLRNDKDPCQEIIDGLHLVATHILVGVQSGSILGSNFGPIGSLVGSFVGGIFGLFTGNADQEAELAECRECYPPTLLQLTFLDDCSGEATFRPIEAGDLVTQLIWNGDNSDPSSASGSRTQSQTFEQVNSANNLELEIETDCEYNGEETDFKSDYGPYNLVNRQKSVSSNAMIANGETDISIPVVNGVVGQSVTVTYDLTGLALDNTTKYSFTISNSVVNGTLISSTSNTATIEWYPDDLVQYAATLMALGKAQITVTNNCSGGKTRIFTISSLILGDDNV